MNEIRRKNERARQNKIKNCKWERNDFISKEKKKKTLLVSLEVQIYHFNF